MKFNLPNLSNGDPEFQFRTREKRGRKQPGWKGFVSLNKNFLFGSGDPKDMEVLCWLNSYKNCILGHQPGVISTIFN